MPVSTGTSRSCTSSWRRSVIAARVRRFHYARQSLWARALMSIRIAPYAEANSPAVETLLDAAFGADRHQRTAYKLRMGLTPLPNLSFAAFAGARLVGVLQSWPVALNDDPLVLVGPVAVMPDAQQGGIGRAMMDAL